MCQVTRSITSSCQPADSISLNEFCPRPERTGCNEDEISASHEWDVSRSCMTVTSFRAVALARCRLSILTFPTNTAPMLKLDRITKRYGTLTALDDVSLDIAPGEFFGLLGPNGAGKSTLMSLVAGLRAPDAGGITLDGKPVTAADPTTRISLGLVPQCPVKGGRSKPSPPARPSVHFIGASAPCLTQESS